MDAITFRRSELGLPMAESGQEGLQAVAGLLMSDVTQADDASRLARILRAAYNGGPDVDTTGNAFSVAVRGPRAQVTFEIDDSIPPARMETLALISVLDAWRGFLLEGRPESWTGAGLR